MDMNKLCHNKLKLHIANLISESLTEFIDDLNILLIYSKIGITPDWKYGHYAFPCFNLDAKIKMSSNEIAAKVKDTIRISDCIENIEAKGPYVNFQLSSKGLGFYIGDEVLNGDYFNYQFFDTIPRTMIEYSQPNTHKELHVGHMRNLCLGDALIKIHKYCGYDIISSTFPGDVGTHVAKCLWYLMYINTEPIPQIDKGAWLGSLYSKAHIKLEDEKDPQLIEDYKKQISLILSQIEKKEGKFYELWLTTREWSIQLMNEIYEWAEVTFDKWYWESEVDSQSVKYIKENLQNGVFIESNNTIGVDLTEYNLGFCMLIKSDGNGLYATKDLELARRKFNDYKIEKSVYIVDKRQSYHFSQVFKVLELLGFKFATNCFHLGYDYVELPSGAMSSRKGNIVPLMDLIEQMRNTIKKYYLDKYLDEMTDPEITSITEMISKGAIRYGMLKIDPNKKIIFDMMEWLKLDGDSGPYLQYTLVRINSVIQKININNNIIHDWSLLSEEIEVNILFKMSEFNGQIVLSCIEYKPNILCNYLYELCKMFNNYYNSVSIKNTTDSTLQLTRLMLIKCLKQILSKGFELVGIPIPMKM